MEKMMRLLLCAYPLGSFIVYWLGLRSDVSYDGTDLLWGSLVTAILTIILYLYFPLSKKIERFSPAWGLGVSMGSSLFFFGLILEHLIENAWGNYMWFFGLWITVHFLGLPKEHKSYKWSFFKRARPIEEESAQLD
ncbi:MAG: hypothetical protein F4Z61_05390 [Acidimicrobiia bacterium]|nr:hypothetical protein [Acidimicrobiia bacterium]MYA82515.1 hypothetical protein [Acidimicrobiales bacterium]MYH74880.1 hypothetical protein [Acidimicrobiales bacterium]